MPLHIISVTLSLLLTSPPGDSLKLTVSPKNEVAAGQEITLEWHVPQHARAYLSRVGEVEAEGKTFLKLNESATLFLALDRGNHFEMRLARITVTGARGFESGEGQYKNPARYPLTGISTPLFLDRIYKVLLQELKYEVKESEVSESRIVLMTDARLNPDLLRATEKKIWSRRVSYRITLRKDEKDQALVCEIEPSIQYKSRPNDLWKYEDPADGSLYEDAANALWASLKPN